MAELSCSVLLPEPLRADEVAEIGALVSAVGWSGHSQVLLSSVEDVDEGPNLYAPAELDQIAAVFGWRPLSQIVCISMVGIDAKYHRLLAEGALALAARFGGVIDLAGTLSRALDAAGQRAAVIYEVVEGRQAVRWVVDVPYLRAWIDHPWFRMVG